MIKCLITDLDGTLFYGHGTTMFDLTKRNTAALKRASEAGLVVAIASGRMISYSQRVADLYSLHPHLLSGFNGAVMRYEDEPSECVSLNKDIVRVLYTEFSTYDYKYMQIQTLDSKRIFDDAQSETACGYKKRSAELGLDMTLDEDIAAWLDHESTSPIGKLSICLDDAKDIDTLIKKIEEAYPMVTATRSSSNLIEVMAKGVNKGRFVDFIMNKMDYKKEDIAAIGDNANDLPMIKASGTSFGMRSGDSGFLKETDHIVIDVAEAIDWILKGR